MPKKRENYNNNNNQPEPKVYLSNVMISVQNHTRSFWCQPIFMHIHWYWGHSFHRKIKWWYRIPEDKIYEFEFQPDETCQTCTGNSFSNFTHGIGCKYIWIILYKNDLQEDRLMLKKAILEDIEWQDSTLQQDSDNKKFM